MEREQRISRRNFLKLSGAAAAGIAVAATFGCTDLEQNPRTYDGEPVEGFDIGDYMTEDFGNGGIILRPNSHTGNFAGIKGQQIYGKSGFEVKAKPYWGRPYPSNSVLGNCVRIDGNQYGVWYWIQKVPAYYKNDAGELVESGWIANDVFVSGNFLTPLGERKDICK